MADKDRENEEEPSQRPDRVDQATQHSTRRPLPPPRPPRMPDEDPPTPKPRHVVLPQTVEGTNDTAGSPTPSVHPLPTAETATHPKTGLARLFRRKDKQLYDGNRGESTTEPEAPRRSISDRRDGMRTKASRILYTTDEEVREALMEFAVFIIFLILTSLVTLSVRHSYMFYFNDTIKRLFTTRDMVIAPSVTISFEKILTIPDFWDYTVYNFLVNLHGDMTALSFNLEEVETADPPQPGGAQARHSRSSRNADQRASYAINSSNLLGRVFLHENLLLGPPRLRQIRVRKDSCYVNDAFIRYFNTCYAAYSPASEEIINDHMGAPFKSMNDLDSTPLWTQLNFYRTGGYTVDLTFSKLENLRIIKKLINQHWLDRGSRLCVIEFNLYNENTDIFQSAKFIAEIPPTGGVIPQSQLQTVKQYSFLTDRSLAMTCVVIFWYIMVVYYTISELSAIRKIGPKNYFKSIMNIQDLLILVFSYSALVYNIWHMFKVNALVKELKSHEEYISLDTLCLWNTIYVDMMAILAFLVWVKIFKFISFNKTLVQFTTTLRRCSKDLAGFSLMFGIVFLAYAQLGLLLFGTKHPDFRNFLTSILTMIRMILGDFQYNLIEQANRVLGPIYFLTYILLVFFILLNMFLAIIMETYNSVKSEITQGRSQLGAYVYKKISAFIYMIRHCGRKRQNRPPPPPAEGEDVDPDTSGNPYQPKERVHLRRNLTEAEAHYFADVPNEVKNKDMYRLNNRVALLEEILEELVTNMDTILKRVESEIKKNK